MQLGTRLKSIFGNKLTTLYFCDTVLRFCLVNNLYLWSASLRIALCTGFATVAVETAPRGAGKDSTSNAC